MSIPPTATPNPSPKELVRSSELPTESSNKHVSAPSSTTGSSAITPAVLLNHNGTYPIDNLLTDNAGEDNNVVQELDNHVTAGDYNGSSNANTPRLPPTNIGSLDLETELSDTNSVLDAPYLPSTMTSLTLQHPASKAPRRSFSTKVISDPSLPSERLPIDLAANNYPDRQQKIDHSSSLAKFHKIGTSSSTETTLRHTPYPRTRSHGALHYAGMNETLEEERSKGLADSAENPESGARQEAFSTENRTRSSSRSSQSRVEKRIEATLAGPEPSSNARSRKSSHILGLFKENTASSDVKRGQEKSRKSSSSPIEESSFPDMQEQGSPLSRHDGPSDVHSESTRRPQYGPARERSSYHVTKPSNNEVRAAIDGQTPRATSPSKTSAGALGAFQISDAVSKDDHAHGSGNPSNSNDSTSANGLPLRLLEEIKDHHNLAAPFHDKFRSSQPKTTGPCLSAEDVDFGSNQQEVAASDQDGGMVTSLSKYSVGPAEEEEESDKEHISSALYFPHQAPSPDALQDVSIDEQRKTKEAQQNIDTQLPEPAISDADAERLPVEDVDIALQSRNENRYLHGDLQKARPTSGDFDYGMAPESAISSASESEYESLEENVPPRSRENSGLGDGETTPRASPTARKSFLQSRRKKTHRAPAAPLGAVELKPYNHQVGGHTNLFRFSKRAVCKQLSNRENVFYEVVEREHPALLKFLPRYDHPRSLPLHTVYFVLIISATLAFMTNRVSLSV